MGVQSVLIPTMSNTTTTEMMKFVFTVDPAYGYSVLVAALSFLLSFWQGGMVGRMRTKLKVDYPAMYSDTQPLFNCYQRAHQNTLERLPLFLVLLLLAGLFNAKIGAAFGFLWLVARVIYSFGYYSGQPKNRVAGSLLSLIIEFSLFVMVFLQAGQMAGWWNIAQAFRSNHENS